MRLFFVQSTSGRATPEHSTLDNDPSVCKRIGAAITKKEKQNNS